VPSLEELADRGSGYIPFEFKEALTALSEAVAAATAGEARWTERLRLGLEASLSFLDEGPQSTRVLILEQPLSGAFVPACIKRLHVPLAPVLLQAREQIIIGAEVRPSTWLIAELVLLGVLSTIRSQMLRGKERPLSELAPSLMANVVEPYLGRGAAKADLSATSPSAAGGATEIEPRVEVVPIRPHPRTLLALRAICMVPRLSTLAVGRAVGIENSGHILGLLRRLQKRGLIENANPKVAREGHAWLLTPYGQRILELVTGSVEGTYPLQPERSAA
jgi:hypothetical protein